MKKLFLTFIWIVFSGFSLNTLASSVNNITVDSGFVRATIPGTSNSSAYMTITNSSDSLITLVGASSNVSERVEIHDHVMVNEMMRMQQRQSVAIDAKTKVTLKPSGLHLMIFDVKQPLLPESTIDITLHFSNYNDVKVTLPVQSIKQEKKQQHHHHH